MLPKKSSWSQILIKRHHRSFRRLFLLSTSTILSQSIIAASSIILTRIYDAEEFGVFAIFSAISALIGMIASLRYEYAISTCPNRAAISRIIVICFMCTLVTTIFIGANVYIFGPAIGQVLESPDLSHLLWLLPITLMSQGISLPIEYLLIHEGKIQQNALNRIIQALSQVILQIGLGIIDNSSVSLIIGYTGGHLVRMSHFIFQLTRQEGLEIKNLRWRTLVRDALDQWQYPIYSSSASLLQGAVLLLPSVFLAILYGPAVAGWFGLGQRVIALPVRLLGQTASQVFLSEAPHMDDVSQYKYFVRTTFIFAVAGIIGLLPFVIFGGTLFAFLFGEEWRPAGIIVQITAPFQWARFVVVPVSQILNLKGKQRLHLLAAAASMIAMLASVAVAWLLALSVFYTIAVYSFGSTLATMLYLLFIWRVARPAR